MRYVSPDAETNQERILAIQKMLPPAAGVTSRTGYASLDELARRLGTTRALVQTWIRDTNPGYPSLKHREGLAKLSKGRYRPEEFSRLRATRPELEARLAELERECALDREIVADLREAVEAIRAAVDALMDAPQVQAAPRREENGPERKAASTRRGAPRQ